MQRRLVAQVIGFLWTTRCVQGAWILGDFSESCFAVCNSRSLSCFEGPNNAVDTPLETLFVASVELGIECLAVDAVAQSEGISSLPRVRVDNDGRNALCQYTEDAPVAICVTIPPASYRRFCCCGTSADDCPSSNTGDLDPPSGDIEDGDTDEDGDSGFDFFGLFGIIGIILGALAAIGGVIGGVFALGWLFGDSDST